MQDTYKISAPRPPYRPPLSASLSASLSPRGLPISLPFAPSPAEATPYKMDILRAKQPAAKWLLPNYARSSRPGKIRHFIHFLLNLRNAIWCLVDFILKCIKMYTNILKYITYIQCYYMFTYFNVFWLCLHFFLVVLHKLVFWKNKRRALKNEA